MNHLHKCRSTSGGFTLLELLVAMAILVTASTIIWSTFSSTITAWERGGEMLDNLHHGEFVMEQLMLGLRSTSFFQNNASKFGFWMESRGGKYPEDFISWVASGTSFIPVDSPLANGLHRIEFTIDEEDGEPGVVVRAYSHLLDEEDVNAETWRVSNRVKGFNCRLYDPEDESWKDEWEDTNSIPRLVEVTLYLDPIEEYGDPVKLQRLIEIPVAPAMTRAVDFAESDSDATP